MKIPHTIPKLILRAYTHKQTPEELAAQYEGRLLRSEDVNWDEGLFNIGFVHPLSQQCLTLIINDYPFYVKLTNEWNRLGEVQHAKQRDQWEVDLANYHKRKLSYDRKKLELDLLLARVGHANLDEFNNQPDSEPDSDDSDDDANEFRKLRNLVEPPFIAEEYADYVPIPQVLDRLNSTDRIFLIEELDIEEIPLRVAVETIPDEYYWERCCNDRWPELDPYDHGDNWKRMYMEKHVREAVEAFHPFESEWPPLLEQIELCASYIITLTLYNLIPECWGVPRKPIVQPIFEGDEPPPMDGTNFKLTAEDDGFQESKFMAEFRTNDAERREKLVDARRKLIENGQEDDMTPQELVAMEAENAAEEAAKTPRSNSHLDISLALPKLSKLTKLSIIYEMAEVGNDWEARFFDFTMKDCEMLAKALIETPTIQHLELNRSRMTGEQTKVLVRDGLLKMPHLKILNLNYNNMGSSGALAIARLFTDETSRVRHTLHTLQMARNSIKSKGAKAIAYGLTLNRQLTFVDLRLNLIGNSGGKDIGHALVVNTTLQSMNLAANHLGDSACVILGKMLQHNSMLKELDLSSNNLGIKGGEAIALAMRKNKTLLKLDVRLCNTTLEFEYDIHSHLVKNRARCTYNLLEREDVYPPTTEGGLEADGNEDEGEDDEEDEGEEEMELIMKFMADDKDQDSDQDDDGNIGGIVKKDDKKKAALLASTDKLAVEAASVAPVDGSTPAAPAEEIPVTKLF